jgi:DNA-binding NarL/FixJ family response regulator
VRGTLAGVATLLIVDDHAAVRAGLTTLVAPEPGLEVVAVEADAEAGLEAAERLLPALALVDVHLPGDDGLSLCLRLRESRPEVAPRVVLYSAFADDLLVILAAVAGADALVPKSADPEELVRTLLAAARGQGSRPTASPSALATIAAALDPADLPILGMLVHGTSPAEVAETLGMRDDWLLARRWAILRRLTPRRARRDTLAAQDRR